MSNLYPICLPDTKLFPASAFLSFLQRLPVLLATAPFPSTERSRLSSYAVVQRSAAGAVQAADVAAPVEGAVAAFGHRLCPRLKAASAAQQLATIQAWRGAVAHPFRCSQSPSFSTVGAEIGRFLKIDQIHGRGRLVRRVFGLQVSRVGFVRGAVAPLVGVNDSGSAVKAVLEEVPHRAEAGQAHPTGAHGAGARHAVALALLTHLCRHRLQGEKKKKVTIWPTFSTRGSGTGPHRSAGLVVVQVGQVAQVSAPLAGVRKLAREHPAKLHVVAAAPPVPVGPPGTSASIIACAGLNGPF